MEINDLMRHPTGFLYLTAYNEEGREIWQDTGKNLIVLTGYKAMAECFTGNTEAAISHVEIGTCGDEPVPGNERITEPVRIDATVTPKGAEGFRLDFTIGYTTANGMRIREFGIKTKDGRLFSRKVRAAIKKTQHMTIVGQWDINF